MKTSGLTEKLIILCLLFFSVGLAASNPADKNLVKTASLCKISDFIEWPERHETFHVAFLSKEEDLHALGDILATQKIKGHSIEVNYIHDMNDIKNNTAILYIASDCNTEIQKIVQTLSGRPVLLVGETTGYAGKGVHINFFITKGGTLHFELNPKSFQQSGLTVNNMLLEYAKIVK